MVGLHELRVVLPVVVLFDPFHYKLAVIVFRSLALAKRNWRTAFALPKKSAPERRSFLYDQIVAGLRISIFGENRLGGMREGVLVQ